MNQDKDNKSADEKMKANEEISSSSEEDDNNDDGHKEEEDDVNKMLTTGETERKDEDKDDMSAGE